ncbi:MAG: hypothetical protein JM58_01515 [Peptococcaceae bacterium BICA1-8]|nr:MAG: hypothetical protein JM58_01515 [Peptococcaceae bacterium BICA1-8]
MKKNGLIFYSVLTVASIFLFSGWYFLEHGQYVDHNSILINRVSFNESEVVLEGDTSNSALAFAGYNYRFEGENLIIKYRYVPVNPFNRLGHFSVAINQGDNKVHKILIEGSEKVDYKQVWTNGD